MRKTIRNELKVAYKFLCQQQYDRTNTEILLTITISGIDTYISFHVFEKFSNIFIDKKDTACNKFNSVIPK